MSETEAQSVMEQFVLSVGMWPMVHVALEAVAGGVRTATFSVGRVPHATLLETVTDRDVGTQIGESSNVQSSSV